jgi:DNA repair protein SbcC/Rad50
MKIKNFNIIKYGPVSEVSINGLSSFNLFFGLNEEGKTFLLEALVWLVSGKPPRGFSCFDRAGGAPTGFAVVEDSGAFYEFPRDGSILDIIGVSGEEFRNIFVIRNSDLAIAGEKDFYSGIADKITGLNTARLEKVKKRLLDMGKLTAETKNFRNVKDEKLLERIGKARELSAEAGGNLEELNRKDFDGLAERKFRVFEQLKEAEEGIDLLQKAREREKYEKGLRALKEAGHQVET